MTKLFQILEASKIGGNDAYELIKRSLSQIFTNKLASEYSWLGKMNKRVFRTLKLSRLLIGTFLIILTYFFNYAILNKC
jgi:hypothetical protein